MSTSNHQASATALKSSRHQGWHNLVSMTMKIITDSPYPQYENNETVLEHKPSDVNDILYKLAEIAINLQQKGHHVRHWDNFLIRETDNLLIDTARLTTVKDRVLRFERCIYRDLAIEVMGWEKADLASRLAEERKAVQTAKAKEKVLQDRLDEQKWEMRLLDLEQEEAIKERAYCIEKIYLFGDPEELWLENRTLKDRVQELEEQLREIRGLITRINSIEC